MGSIVSYLDFVYMENHVRESLTSMTVCAGRTVQVRRSVVGVRQRTLEKNMETLRRGVSDHHNGHAGRTIVDMTVCRTCLLEDT